MKQAMQAVATIALAVGLATAAQAAGSYPQDAASTTTNRHAAATEQTQPRSATGHVSKEQIKQAQQQLKSDGLFRGAINGRMTHQTKVAISRFQQQNGLRRTATLDHQTMAKLGGGGMTGAGVGSSMPSGSSQPETTTPPAASAPTTGAGGMTAPSAPSSTTPAPLGAPKQP